MRIGILAPSIYMSPTRFRDMIFAPRDLVVTLADSLVEKGHSVFFFTAPDVKSKAVVVGGDEKLLFGEFSETKLAAGESERLKWASFYGVKKEYELDLTSRCYKMAVHHQLDVVHSYHDTFAHYFDDLTGFPTVYTLHDPLPTEEKDIKYWLYNKFKQHKYVSISNAFRKQGAFELNFIDTVYHGLDPANYPFCAENENYLVAMGRMVPQKGLEDAVEVSARLDIPLKLATSDLNTNVHLKYFEEVLGPKLKANPKAELTGFLSDQNKADVLGKARAFLFPIKWEEPFGMVMIEAMACGTPVIAYNRGSVPEIVEDGVTGFIVEPEDTDSGTLSSQKNSSQSADALRSQKNLDPSSISKYKLINKPNSDKKGEAGQNFSAPRAPVTSNSQWIIKKKGIEGLAEAVKRIGEIDRKACRRHMEEKFTVERVVDNYIKVYEKVIRNSQLTVDSSQK